MKNLDKLLNFLFGRNMGWDKDSNGYKWWKKYVKKQKTSLKNLKRRGLKILNEN